MSFECEASLGAAGNSNELLRRITDYLRRSQDLGSILNTAVTEVGAFLTVDRVEIYEFQADSSGQVVAEWIGSNRLASLLGVCFTADDIPAEAREFLIQAQVADDGTQDSARELRPTDCLMAIGVASSLVVPIHYHDYVWGLIVAHHAEPREISASEVQAVERVVDLLSVAISQSILTMQAREQAHRESTINHISRLLHSLSAIELEAALEATVLAFDGSGGRLWLQADAFNPQGTRPTTSPSCYLRLYRVGTQPIIPLHAPYTLMEQYPLWQDYFKATQEPVWAIADVYEEPGLNSLQSAFRSTSIRGLLVVPLWYRYQLLGYLSVFRDEVEANLVWAEQGSSEERSTDSPPFQGEKATKRGYAVDWTLSELELAQALGQQFATAIQQYETHQQLQTLNSRLEGQVQERTAQLQQATEQQRILFEVVTKTRRSLDFQTIFTTVTQEVRQSLNADRAIVFCFDPTSQSDDGDVVAEDGLPDFPTMLSQPIHGHCLGENYLTQYQQGHVTAIVDIHQAEFKDCYVALLDRFAIKANIVAPLIKGEKLWGLLCVHQCDKPRDWQPTEIQFVTQVAIQLGIGLEQADLLAQTQLQAEQLAYTLRTLKHTQGQLIQTEKMSSLGQLVAGIAHEINNPVNFIAGNLNYVKSYIDDLLALIQTYQTCYPEPHPQVIEQMEAIDLEFMTQDLPKTVSSMKIGTDRIRQIVLSLRNFSRLDQSEVKPIDIHEGIESTLLILQHRLKAPDHPNGGITLEKEYGELPLVECYASQLNQAFMNVLSNAIDALEEAVSQGFGRSPMILIRTESIDDDRVVIRIRDNGLGIPAGVKAQIFEPFFTTKPIGKGTGMGLSISREIIVDKHRGVFKCHSQTGESTEFWIEVPVKQKPRYQEDEANHL
jgi:GAF domain-containing protein